MLGRLQPNDNISSTVGGVVFGQTARNIYSSAFGPVFGIDRGQEKVHPFPISFNYIYSYLRLVCHCILFQRLVLLRAASE